MFDLLAIVAGLAIGIALLVLVAGVLERRARSKGPLFTGPPSLLGKAMAILFAVVFGLAFAAELLFEDRYHIVFPVLTLALVAYAFGAHRLLGGIQGATHSTRPNDKDV